MASLAKEAKDGRPPCLPADLADYIMARGDEPCGRTVCEAIMKAVCWIESEWAVDSRATTGRIAWAMKDTVVERLSWKAPWTRCAPGYPAAILARWERIVLDLEVAVGWRIWAWAKLLKVWGSLPWSDLQAMIPGEMSMVEGRLSTISGRRRRQGLTVG